jgi:hypothetical protein
LAANTPRLSDCRGRVDIDKDRILDIDQIGADSLQINPPTWKIASLETLEKSRPVLRSSKLTDLE